MPIEISLPMDDPSIRTVKGGRLQAPTIQMFCHRSVDVLTDLQNAEMDIHVYKQNLSWSQS